MPFYEYECRNCGAQTEVLQKISDPPLRKCPECGKSRLVKLVSAPIFRLKGAGWYETDFKSEQDAKRNLAGDQPEAGNDAKTETKAEAGDDAKAAPKGDGKSDSKAEAKADGKGAAEADGKAASKAGSKSGGRAAVAAGSKAASKTATKSRARPKPKNTIKNNRSSTSRKRT